MGGEGRADISCSWGEEGTLPGFSSQAAHWPGIEDVFRMSSAGVAHDVAALTVEGGPVRQAHNQEVGPQVTCGHLGDVGQGAAGHATKHKGPQMLVDHSHVDAAHEGW